MPTPEPTAAGQGAAWRKAERARLIAARLGLAPEQRAAASRAIDAALAARFPPGAIALVGGYWPIRGEYDPLPYLRRVIDAGGAAALPVVVGPRAPLEFRPWTPRRGHGARPLGHAASRGRADGGADGAADPAGRASTPPAIGWATAAASTTARWRRCIPARSPSASASSSAGFASFEPAAHDQRMDVIVTEAGVFETVR